MFAGPPPGSPSPLTPVQSLPAPSPLTPLLAASPTPPPPPLAPGSSPSALGCWTAGRAGRAGGGDGVAGTTSERASRRVRFPATAVFLDAVAQGEAALVQQCLDGGVPATYTNEAGTTALHLAAATGRLDLVELLLNAGADPNAVNDIHCTPLHIAADVGDLRVCQALLARGANPALPNEDGDIPADVATAAEVTDALLGALPTDALEAWLHRRSLPDEAAATPPELAEVAAVDGGHDGPEAQLRWPWTAVAAAGVVVGAILLLSRWSARPAGGDLWTQLFRRPSPAGLPRSSG